MIGAVAFQLTSLEWKLNDCKELRRGEHNDYKDNDYYYYYASFLSRNFSHKSSNSKALTHTSIRIKKKLKALLKNKSIGSVIKIKINQCSS